MEGFTAQVTAKQLEAKLGPPVITDGEAVWKDKKSKRELHFRQSRDGFHLSGERLLLGRQVLAEASELPFIRRLGQPDQSDTEKYTNCRQIRGESVRIQNENQDLGEPAEYESAIRYRNQPDVPYELVVNLVVWPKGSDRIDSFELVWNLPGANDPVIGGYSAGQLAIRFTQTRTVMFSSVTTLLAMAT